MYSSSSSDFGTTKLSVCIFFSVSCFLTMKELQICNDVNSDNIIIEITAVTATAMEIYVGYNSLFGSRGMKTSQFSQLCSKGNLP